MSATFPSQTVRTALGCAFGQHAPESAITIRPAAPHQSNRLYDIFVESEHLIAKEYLRADAPDAAPHEYAALRYLQSLQLAPQPVFFDPSIGPVVVYQYMKGEMWDRRVPSASELGDLARAWLRRVRPFETGGCTVDRD